jgi:predicted RNase H-like HicB family nuclease
MKSTAYEMILWWSNEDDCYVVDVPELPGCMAHGSSRAEAIQNAEEAIALWVQSAREDGICVPKPKGRLLFA